MGLISSVAHSQADFRIGFILDGSNESLELQDGIIREVSVLLGTDVDVERTSYIGAPRPESLKALADQAYEDDSIDVVVAPGFLGSNFLYSNNYFPKPTFLSQVIAPVISNNEFSAQRPNLYWLSRRLEMLNTLEAIQNTLNPKHITLLLSVAREYIEEDVLNRLLEQGESLGMVIDVVQFNSKIAASKQVLDSTELVLLAPLSHHLSTRVIRDLSGHNIPVFTFSGRRVVEQGALMTDRGDADITQIARRVALDLQAVYLNEAISPGPRWLEMKQELILNMGVAAKLGIDLPIDVLSNATLIGEIPAGVDSIELEELVSWVIENNPALEQSKLAVRVADEGMNQSHSVLLPQLNAAIKHERDDTSGASAQAGNPAHDTLASLTLSQNVYSVSKNSNLELARLTRKVTQHEYSAVELDLIQQTISGYLNVLSAQSAVNTGVENLRLSRDTLSMTSKRQRFGSGTLADVYTSQSSIATAESALLSTRINSLEARRALKELTNIQFDEKAPFSSADFSDEYFAPTHELVLPSLETIGGIQNLAEISAEYAKEVDPAILASAVTIESKEVQLDAARKNRFTPEVNLSGQAFQYLESDVSSTGVDLDNVNDWSVSLNVNIPLWNSGNLASVARQAGTQKTVSELAHIATRNSLDTVARNSAFSIGQAWRNIKLGRIALDSARKSLEIDQTAYASGAITITTLQNSQNAFIAALEGAEDDKYQYLNALVNWQRRMAAMPALMGKSGYQQWVENFKTRLYSNTEEETN